MASANLQLARSLCADWERGDFSSAEWAHPDIEYVVADGPAPGTWTGLSEMAAAYREFLEAWDAVRVEADEFRELDGERVVVVLRRAGRGKASGLELGATRTQGASVLHVRDGRVTRMIIYWDRDRAFADLGLSADRDAADPPGSS